jgi:hypothetical protein
MQSKGEVSDVHIAIQRFSCSGLYFPVFVDCYSFYEVRRLRRAGFIESKIFNDFSWL